MKATLVHPKYVRFSNMVKWWPLESHGGDQFHKKNQWILRMLNDFTALHLKTHPSTSVWTLLSNDLGFNRLLPQVNDLLSQRQILLAGHDYHLQGSIFGLEASCQGWEYLSISISSLVFYISNGTILEPSLSNFWALMVFKFRLVKLKHWMVLWCTVEAYTALEI